VIPRGYGSLKNRLRPLCGFQSSAKINRFHLHANRERPFQNEKPWAFCEFEESIQMKGSANFCRKLDFISRNDKRRQGPTVCRFDLDVPLRGIMLERKDVITSTISEVFRDPLQLFDQVGSSRLGQSPFLIFKYKLLPGSSKCAILLFFLQIIDLDGSEVSLLGGVVGSLKKLAYTMTRTRIADGLWFNTSSFGDFEGRKLIDAMRIKTRSQAINFRPLS